MAILKQKVGNAALNRTVIANYDASTFVHKSGNETVAGTKTFTESPLVPTVADPSDASMKVASTEFVQDVVSEAARGRFIDTRYATREDYFQAKVAADLKAAETQTMPFDLITFTTASENPLGTNTVGDRWFMQLMVVRHGEGGSDFVRIMAYERSGANRIYTCFRLQNGTWEDWKEVVTGNGLVVNNYTLTANGQSRTHNIRGKAYMIFGLRTIAGMTVGMDMFNVIFKNEIKAWQLAELTTDDAAGNLKITHRSDVTGQYCIAIWDGKLLTA